MKALYEIYDTGTLQVSISGGNVKLGNIPQLNLLPGNEPLVAKGRTLTNIDGTCGKYCSLCKKECYAIKSAILHHNRIIKNWAANTTLLRNDPQKVRLAIKEYCQKNIVKYFRFHTSGELESVDHLKLYCDICNDTPDVVFYIYTKAFDILAAYLAIGYTIPENFIINLSEWHGNLDRFKEKGLFREFNIFAYDDGQSGAIVEDMVHCPAQHKTGYETGVTCAQCRRCMRKGSITATYAH